MGTRKEQSTNSINEDYLKENCGIAFTLSLVGGRWKISILSYLLHEPKLRYSELKKRLKGISERVLAAKLKELENDGLIMKTIYPQVPPRVEYELTASGYSLKGILDAMDKWGEANLAKREIAPPPAADH